jgi:hypothetical protein
MVLIRDAELVAELRLHADARQSGVDLGPAAVDDLPDHRRLQLR